MKKLSDEEKKKEEKEKMDKKRKEMRLRHPWTIALRKHIEEQGHGSETRLAKRVIIPPKKEGITQQYITRLKNGERGGSEAVRRKISELIGEDYEKQMAGKPVMPIADRETLPETAEAIFRAPVMPEYGSKYVLDQLMDIRGVLGELSARVEAIEKRLK